MKINDIVHSVVCYILLIIALAIFALPGIILFLMPTQWRRKSKIFFYFMHIVYWVILRCTMLPIKIVGSSNIPQSPAIIVANHQSALDIPLVGVLLKGHAHIWLAWSALFKRFGLKFIMPRIALPIVITSPAKALRSLLTAIGVLESNAMHGVIFPEGGRFIDGKVHDFFSGFIVLAKKTGRPVVPVCIVNANKVYPPGAIIAHWHPIKLIVGTPMTLSEGESDEEFKERVSAWFEQQLR